MMIEPCANATRLMSVRPGPRGRPGRRSPWRSRAVIATRPAERAAREPGEYKALGDDDKPTSSNIAALPLAGGTFDVTDFLMRRHGQDPYASQKLKVLDATRDERAQIGAAHRHEQLVHAPQLMKAALERVWTSHLDLPAKKRAVFELWDDCAETGADDLHPPGPRVPDRLCQRQAPRRLGHGVLGRRARAAERPSPVPRDLRAVQPLTRDHTLLRVTRIRHDPRGVHGRSRPRAALSCYA
jgi:hypothetical protein